MLALISTINNRLYAERHMQKPENGSHSIWFRSYSTVCAKNENKKLGHKSTHIYVLYGVTTFSDKQMYQGFFTNKACSSHTVFDLNLSSSLLENTPLNTIQRQSTKFNSVSKTQHFALKPPHLYILFYRSESFIYAPKHSS